MAAATHKKMNPDSNGLQEAQHLHLSRWSHLLEKRNMSNNFLKHKMILPVSLMIPLALSCTASLGIDESEGSPESTFSSNGSADVLAIALVNGERDSVKILEYDGNCLREKSQINEFVDNPRSIAIRDDKREAIVAYGAVDRPSGVLVLELELEDNSAVVKQNLQFDFQALPNGIAYEDDNKAVVMGGVSQIDVMIPILRDSGGLFRTGDTTEVAGDFVVDAGNAGDTPLLLRGNPGTGDPLELWSLESDAESYSLVGSPLLFEGVHELSAHPTLPTAYVSAKDPEKLFGDLEPKGFLHVVESRDGSATLVSSFEMPGEGTQLDVSPDGDFIVTDVALGQLDQNGRPETRARTIQVVDLNQSGIPTGATLVEAEIPMLLMHDIKVAPNNNIVLSIERIAAESTPETQNPLSIVRVNGDQITETCQDLHLGGQVVMEFVE